MPISFSRSCHEFFVVPSVALIKPATSLRVVLRKGLSVFVSGIAIFVVTCAASGVVPCGVLGVSFVEGISPSSLSLPDAHTHDCAAQQHVISLWGDGVRPSNGEELLASSSTTSGCAIQKRQQRAWTWAINCVAPSDCHSAPASMTSRRTPSTTSEVCSP